MEIGQILISMGSFLELSNKLLEKKRLGLSAPSLSAPSVVVSFIISHWCYGNDGFLRHKDFRVYL